MPNWDLCQVLRAHPEIFEEATAPDCKVLAEKAAAAAKVAEDKAFAEKVAAAKAAAAVKAAAEKAAAEKATAEKAAANKVAAEKNCSFEGGSTCYLIVALYNTQQWSAPPAVMALRGAMSIWERRWIGKR